MRTLVLDTETTGLLANSSLPVERQPSCIEYYGEIVEDDGTVIDKLHFLCNPGFMITPTITKITGIKNMDLQGLPKFAEYIPALNRQLEMADAVAAHYFYFDSMILKYEYERVLMMDGPKWPAKQICTMQDTEWMTGKRLSLSKLHMHLFGEAFAGAHRANVDVPALTRCVLELRNRGAL